MLIFLIILGIGWAINLLICAISFYQNRRYYDFFKLAIIPYGIPILIVLYVLFEFFEFFEDKKIQKRKDKT